MNAVVLAAGKGTRLQALTEDKTSGMGEVMGRPIRTHCVDQLVELTASELLVVVGFQKETFVSHYRRDGRPGRPAPG